MKFTVILLLLGIIVSVYGDCEYKNKTYKEGETWTIEGRCNKYRCHASGSVTAVTCSPKNIDDPSKYIYVKKDISKPYPACCAHYEKKVTSDEEID